MLRAEPKVIRGNPSKRRVPKFAPQGITRSACLDRRDAAKAVALRGTRCAAGPADRYDREAVGSVGCRQRRAPARAAAEFVASVRSSKPRMATPSTTIPIRASPSAAFHHDARHRRTRVHILALSSVGIIEESGRGAPHLIHKVNRSMNFVSVVGGSKSDARGVRKPALEPCQG
jgi:hypothetical protein